MLSELAIHSLSQRLGEKEGKIVESLYDYKKLNQKFAIHNPFKVSYGEILNILSNDPFCIDYFNSIALPLEHQNWERGEVALTNPPGETPTGMRAWSLDVLKENTIAAVDASTIEHNLHQNLLYAYTQVGVYWRGAGKCNNNSVGDLKIGDELYTPGKSIRIFDKVDYQKWNWDLTIKLLKESFEGYLPFILFLDESLSISYAQSYTRERQAFLLDSLKGYLRQLDELSITPVSVYHSLDRGLINLGLKCSACKDTKKCGDCLDKPSEEELLFRNLSDKLFLSDILKTNYSRTPYFRPINRVIAKDCYRVELDLVAFYVRVDGSILRIEFPYKYLETDVEVVNKVHKAVVADSLLTKGYPYTLMNAHELAVLSSKDRNTVNEIVHRKALELSAKYGVDLTLRLTRKGELKMRGIV